MMSTGRVILALGLLALLAQAYALTGRAPDPDLMRGLRAGVAHRHPGLRGDRRRRDRRRLGAPAPPRARRRRARRAVPGDVASPRSASCSANPLSGAFEFPHRADELAATRLLLLATALLLGLLGCWPTMRAAIDRRRAAGDRGAALALGLARDAATLLAGRWPISA